MQWIMPYLVFLVGQYSGFHAGRQSLIDPGYGSPPKCCQGLTLGALNAWLPSEPIDQSLRWASSNTTSDGSAVEAVMSNGVEMQGVHH